MKKIRHHHPPMTNAASSFKEFLVGFVLLWSPWLPYLPDFEKITSLNQIDSILCCPIGYTGQTTENHRIFYRINFDEASGFPKIIATIVVDHDLHVKLQCNGCAIPLPKWFTVGHNAKLTKISMIQQFAGYLAEQDKVFPKGSILEELQQRQLYHPKGCPPCSSDLLRFSLLLRYTSAQAYRLLLQQFRLPSFSFLATLSKGISSLNVAKALLDKGCISQDIIVLCDEMYLQKETQYHGGSYVGADEDGNFYSGIIVMMIIGLKKSIPVVVRALPETKITGEKYFETHGNIINTNKWNFISNYYENEPYTKNKNI